MASLIGFNLFIMFLIIFTRSHQRIQLGLFLFLLAICYLLEWINSYLGQNWKTFTTQNYFDKSGFFVCVMIGVPALCNCVLIMINSFRNTFSLLVQVAKSKIKKE